MPSSNAGPLLFVTSYTKFDNLAHSPRGTQAEHSVRTYGLDCGTGQLTLLSVNHEDTQKRIESGRRNGVMNPAFTRMHPTKNVIYSCTESVEEDGEIVCWDVCPETGKLSLLSSADAFGTSTCYITIDKEASHALVVNYWNATVVVLEMDKRTGAIKQSGQPKSIFDPNKGRSMLAQSQSHVSHSNNDSDTIKERQMDPHSHAVILDPFFGKIAFVPDLGMDLIRQLAFDPTRGKLHPAGSIRSGGADRAALGPRYIEFHPTLPIAYVVNELSSEVAVFRFNKEKAKEVIATMEDEGDVDAEAPPQCLELVQMISTIPPAFPNVLNTCGRITVHSTGRYVLVSNRGHDSICVLSVEKNTGLLQSPSYQHTRGATPRHFQFDPSGEWLIVANQDTDNIGIFHFSLSTGQLKWTGNEYHVPSPNFVCCVEPVDPSSAG